MYHRHNNYVNDEQTEIHQTPIMGFIVNNANNSLRVCLTVLKVVGFLTPPQTGIYSFFLSVYCFASFMFLVGGIIIAQTGAMFQIWGDLALMTSASFLLFTNLAFALKIINVVARRRQIQDIIDDADEVLVAEDREEGKEIIKRYPYDASKSPAYELTYFNQSSSVTMASMVNTCLDVLVASMIAVCRCRLGLVGLSLRRLCEGIPVIGKDLLTSNEEKIVQSRLRQCVIKHEAALKSTRLIQKCFSYPILAQFTVSAVIICVTAYQLAMELDNGNRVRSIPMATYLLCMMLQVYIYCYQGNQLTEEIIKASYTFFTVLKQVEDRNPK
ncbi:hypothetical protein HF086_008582 [Spodoptera exigua]|uniref:Odorant receptor n=1 Tax=Spodoptera exigua TaxID=7107 RepID=A0A922S9S6_SPOEX|nr:hypothetical protein HF086_008582 [Spodoptera exigua]